MKTYETTRDKASDHQHRFLFFIKDFDTYFVFVIIGEVASSNISLSSLSTIIGSDLMFWLDFCFKTTLIRAQRDKIRPTHTSSSFLIS